MQLLTEVIKSDQIIRRCAGLWITISLCLIYSCCTV